jgi:hypothetical protein
MGLSNWSIGETFVPALMTVGQSSVVDAQLMQECRQKTRAIHRLVHSLVAELVCRTVDETSLETPARRAFGRSIK